MFILPRKQSHEPWQQNLCGKQQMYIPFVKTTFEYNLLMVMEKQILQIKTNE